MEAPSSQIQPGSDAREPSDHGLLPTPEHIPPLFSIGSIGLQVMSQAEPYTSCLCQNAIHSLSGESNRAPPVVATPFSICLGMEPSRLLDTCLQHTSSQQQSRTRRLHSP